MYTYEILIEMAVEFGLLMLLIWLEERYFSPEHS